MASAAIEYANQVRVADPKPDYCSRCFRGAQEGVEFLDLMSSYEGPTIVHPETGAVIGTIDDLYLCFTRDESGQVASGCVKEICEAGNLRPELHQRQLREIRRLELEAEHWKSAEKRQRAEADRLRERLVQVEAELVGKAPRGPGRPRKAR